MLPLDLTPELQQRLSEAAAHEGVPASDYLLCLLDRHLPQTDRQRALIALLQSWIAEDVTDEDDTESEAVLPSLGEHRGSDRHLFTEKVRGFTW